MQVKKHRHIATLLFLAGCSAPSDLSDMRTSIGQRLATDPSAITDSEKTTIPLSQGLGPALRTAVLVNDAYIAALARERQAMRQVNVATSVRRPQVTGNANIGSVSEVGADGASTTGIAGGVTLSQLLYDGGASVSAINLSSARALSAQSARMTAANEIALAAARAWLDLWQYSERLRLMRSRVSEMEILVEQIERMASNGLLDKASLENAQGQIVEFRLEESQLVSQHSQAHVRFQRFFNAKPSSVARPGDIVSAAEVRELAGDWQNSPNLQRLAAEILAAQASVKEAESAFRPNVNLQAGLQSPFESDSSSSLSLGLAMQYTFSDGGRRVAQLAASEEIVAATDAQLTNAQRDLFLELQGLLSQLASIERALPLLEQKLSLSKSEADTSRSQMLTGQSNLRQLVDVEIEIYRAEDQKIALQAEKQAVMLAIASLAGRLSDLIGLHD